MKSPSLKVEISGRTYEVTDYHIRARADLNVHSMTIRELTPFWRMVRAAKNLLRFSLYRAPGVYWMRICGLGFHVKDTRRHGLLFSERNGYCWRLQVGAWSFRFLS
jgi:hypothetical protein